MYNQTTFCNKVYTWLHTIAEAVQHAHQVVDYIDPPTSAPPTSSLHCDVERARHEQPTSCKKASTIARDDEQTTVQSLHV